MTNLRLTFIGIFSFTSILILPSNKTVDMIPVVKEDNTIEDISTINKSSENENSITYLNSIKTADDTSEDKIISRQTAKSDKIIKGGSIEMIKGRRPYDLGGREFTTKHFVVRETKPDNPFGPHKHNQSELWFILEGKGKVFLDGIEYEVEENDLIILDPWVEHGLSTTGQVTWICLG